MGYMGAYLSKAVGSGSDNTSKLPVSYPGKAVSVGSDGRFRQLVDLVGFRWSSICPRL